LNKQQKQIDQLAAHPAGFRHCNGFFMKVHANDGWKQNRAEGRIPARPNGLPERLD
jgi:hypothetical protein